jgi:hypothetical protein
MLALAALAVAFAGCGGVQVTSPPPETAGDAVMTPESLPTQAATVNPTPRPTVSPGPAETPRPSPYLPDVNADSFKETLIDNLDFTCAELDGTDQLIWTCSHGDEVAVSVYGPNSASVSALRVVTQAGREVDRRSWIRGFASMISVDVISWAGDNFGSNETAKVGGVWVQTTHDAKSDGLLISTEHIGP